MITIIFEANFVIPLYFVVQIIFLQFSQHASTDRFSHFFQKKFPFSQFCHTFLFCCTDNFLQFSPKKILHLKTVFLSFSKKFFPFSQFCFISLFVVQIIFSVFPKKILQILFLSFPKKFSI